MTWMFGLLFVTFYTSGLCERSEKNKGFPVLSPKWIVMQNHILKLVVFTSGMSVMAVEMSGLRLLAPYYGTSLIVTTVLIGSLMGFLSLGYWLGGRWGDKHPNLKALSKVTMVASGFIVLIPFISQPILRTTSSTMRMFLSGDGNLESSVALFSIGGGIVATLGLMAIPITLMGAVSPWAVRLAVDSVNDSGKAAGRLYALSTFGSILGSFLPALVLIPLLGVQRTYLAIGVVFLAVSCLGLFTGLMRAVPPAVLLLGFFLPPAQIRPVDVEGGELVWEEESIYHFIQVVRQPLKSGCKDAYVLYLNEGIASHSIKCLEEGRATKGIWAYMAATPLWMDDPKALSDVLLVGLAGGTVAKQLLQSFPDAKVDGVEIDGAVVEVGKEFFDNSHPNINPIVMDGRMFLSNTDSSYDLVLMDAYRQPYIPFHLVTQEFFQQVHDHLNEDGVLAVNVASVRGVSKDLAAMIYRTMKDVFPTVTLVRASRSNDVIIATKKQKDPFIGADHMEKYGLEIGLRAIKKKFRKKITPEVDGWKTARLLTDDQAPVEMAWDLMAFKYAK